MSDDRRKRYAAAFYAQAASDWRVYALLVSAKPDPVPWPVCHSLHYLQMACEKLGKAYRLQTAGANVDVIATRHVGFTQFINGYLRSPAIAAEYEGKTAALKNVLKTSAAIAREIEKLAPATDRAHAPENAEYPWERGDWELGSGEVFVPCAYPFPTLSLLDTVGGSAFLKLVGRAFRDWKP